MQRPPEQRTLFYIEAMSAKQGFTALNEQLQTDKDVLGIFLSGSRGKGFHTASSDYDVYIVVQDAAVNRAKLRYSFRYSTDIDCTVISLTDFRAYAEWGVVAVTGTAMRSRTSRFCSSAPVGRSKS